MPQALAAAVLRLPCSIVFENLAKAEGVLKLFTVIAKKNPLLSGDFSFMKTFIILSAPFVLVFVFPYWYCCHFPGLAYLLGQPG